ncbi:hypothetical protein U472_00050 [Orenia metallireducens]|uniref:Aldose 1-epimerase n=1 Tax=Orenia metallireducens TaxID=1413210 RepID=A0A1C0ADH1_9FIRM|nr:aldose epimerase family protein [Orenia metallireducens]OCL28748.1 hypothetical protein U472_00050 [Orenia metallireducens]
MEINKEFFGNLKTGEEVIKYTLNNEQLQLSILNYGGIITELYTPNKDGKRENIVLGFDNIRAYEESSPYFGAITGRHAGRIANAQFSLKGEKYQLKANEGKHNLHGGLIGLDKRIWEVNKLTNGLELSYFSPHLEEGFPANVTFKVRYLLIDNQLKIEYLGEPDRPTLINLTNHSYFNLAGDGKRDILKHQLKIDAQNFIALNKESIPTEEVREVVDTPFDFREFKEVGAEINTDYQQLKFTGGYDHPFILDHGEESIVLKDQESGRAMSISTDQPVLVFYSGNYLAEEGILNNKVKARRNLALCLETQDYPNAINLENFPTKIYTANNPYQATTSYKFYID